MADYEFISPDGNVVTRDMSPSDLMDLPLEDGSLVLVEDGVRMKRHKPSVGGIIANLEYDHDQYPKISSCAERFSGGSAGCDHVHAPGTKDHGKVILKSARQQREYCRANGYTRDY